MLRSAVSEEDNLAAVWVITAARAGVLLLLRHDGWGVVKDRKKEGEEFISSVTAQRTLTEKMIPQSVGVHVQYLHTAVGGVFECSFKYDMAPPHTKNTKYDEV